MRSSNCLQVVLHQLYYQRDRLKATYISGIAKIPHSQILLVLNSLASVGFVVYSTKGEKLFPASFEALLKVLG
jgi:hypothetical protein